MSLPIISSIFTTLLFGSIAIILSIREERMVERLFDQDRKNKQRLYEITILKEIQERIGYALDIEKVVEVILGSLKNLLPYTSASSIIIKDHKCVFKTHLEEAVSSHYLDEVKKSMLTSLKSLSEDPIPTKIEEHTSGLAPDEKNNHPMASFFHIPIILDDKVIGLLNISSTAPDLYTEEEMSLLYQITNQASNALSRLQSVLNTEKGKLMAMISSLIDGVFMVDVNKNVLVMNPAAKEFLKIRKEQPTFVDVITNLPKPDVFVAKIEKAIQENKIIEEKEIQLGEKYFHIFITPVLNEHGIATLNRRSSQRSSVIGASVLFHDITLEKNIAQMKEDFTNIMVHELRSPLTAIKASAQLIKMQDEKLSVEERAKLLELINTQAKKLLDEVAMILDAAKLETGALVIERKMGDLKKLIAEQIEVFTPPAVTKHIQLLSHVDENLPETAFDERYITEVLNNLLSNSLKFTPVGGKIMVSAIMQGKKILIAVSDNGPGIPKERQDVLFHKFSQISRANANIGTGLGLYISKGIVEAHGGSITLDSDLGRGTTISFTLPVVTTEDKEDTMKPHAALPLPN